MPRSPIDFFVLDAIAFDAEQLDDIVKYLNEPDSDWRDRFERLIQPIEVQAALMRLVKDGSVEVHVFDTTANDYLSCGEGVWPARHLNEMFFDLTGRGRVLYLNLDF